MTIVIKSRREEIHLKDGYENVSERTDELPFRSSLYKDLFPSSCISKSLLFIYICKLSLQNSVHMMNKMYLILVVEKI